MGIHDLNRMIRNWVESNHRNNIDEREISRIEIDWHKVSVTTTSSWTEEEEEEEHRPRYPIYLPNYPTIPAPTPTPPSQLIFRSNYKNETDEDQIHVFNMRRSTDAKVQTKMTQGFSRDGLVGIVIGVPEEVSRKTGNFGCDIPIHSVDENTVKHTVTWGMNSKINVVAGKKTVAELRVTEEEFDCDFGASVAIRGRIIARVFYVNTANMKLFEGDIATVLKNERDQGRFIPDNNVRFQGNKVTWRIGGKLKFKFGVYQNVEVWNEKL